MNDHEALLEALSNVTGRGDFHSSGKAPFFFPILEVTGLGELAFPLPASQAKDLISLADAAPYGLGEKTVLDDRVRKCWQIDASNLSFKAPEWQGFLDATVERVRKDLGITGKISAIPYKLLIYAKGGHFRTHRDTEKLGAMFGTLIIALPSAHEGGRLFIRHDGREIEADFSSEKHAFQHAAFFADCEHEVAPVLSGFRCCLVYNLRLDAGDPGHLNLSLTTQARTLLAPLEKLRSELDGELAAVQLEHSYTEANLSLRNLKGNDRARALALFAAANEAGFAAHLALVTFHKSGELENGYDYGRRGRYGNEKNPADGTMGESYEESLTIGNWRNAADESSALGIYRIEPEQVIAKHKINEGEPDEKEAEGYTGNAGCTIEYWYHRAAIVLWAKEDHERILCLYDFGGACTSLAELSSAKDTGPTSAFHRLGQAVIDRYSDSHSSAIFASTLRNIDSHPFPITLRAVTRAGSRKLLERFLANIEPEHFVLCGAKLWTELFKSFGVEPFEVVSEQLVNDGVAENRSAIFQLLDALLARKDAASWASALAEKLAMLTPGTPSPDYRWSHGDPQVPGDREESRILLEASHLLESAKGRKAAIAFLRSDSSLAYVREILGPVLQEKSVRKFLAVKNSLVPEILAFAKSLLGDEVARPLPPYPDWTRPAPQPAAQRSGPIRELLVFMADPAAETYRFTESQGERTQLESFIAGHRLDLDHVTITKGRPYTLACTKNDNSHQRALARRVKDHEMLNLLTPDIDASPRGG